MFQEFFPAFARRANANRANREANRIKALETFMVLEAGSTKTIRRSFHPALDLGGGCCWCADGGMIIMVGRLEEEKSLPLSGKEVSRRIQTKNYI
jgi:hypothetical protein